MAALKVKAVYEYTSQEPDDLSFPVGQIINITEEIDADWYEGEYTDASGVKKTGIFPNNFVEKYEPEVPSRPSRPTRPKQDSLPAAAPAAVQREPESVPEPEPVQQEVPREEDSTPPVPASSKPQQPPVIIPAELPQATDEVRSPPSAVSERSPVSQAEPPSAPKPAPAEPVSAESRKPPPPVAPKSNAFKDRIAAFNQPAAAPVLPFQPQGHKSQPSNFIKKPFVAPPPSSSAYVPPPIKQEPQHIPYRREEDPEIKQRQEEDKAAAEAAGFGGESQQGQQEEGDEDAPKPQSLKERIALLQKQQAEQAQRRAGGGEKKEKKAPTRKASEPAPEGDNDELERVRSPGDERQSLDVSRDRPRVPSVPSHTQEPMSPLPDAPQHEILSGGEEADQSAAGETTEDDAGTIGPEDSDAQPVPVRRASTAPKAVADVGDEQDTTEDAEEEDEEEDSMDEETRKREELRQRMAKMSGGMGMAGMFGPPGGMPMPGKSAPKKRASTKDSNRQASGDTQSPTSPGGEQQRMPMMPIPGMHRVQSPQNEEPRRSVEKEREQETHPISSQREPDVVPDVEDVKPEPLPRASLTEERGAPPVPKGEQNRESLQLLGPIQRSHDPSDTSNTPPRMSGADAHAKRRSVAKRAMKRPLSQVAPPVPGDRPIARPPPGPPAPESRPVPPPPPPAAPVAMPLSPGPGSESDDEASVRHLSAQTPTAEPSLPIRNAPPAVPTQRDVPTPQPKRASYFGTDESAPHTAPSNERRSSRVPPIPSGSPLVSPRPPPPPPPQVPPPQPAALATEDDERGESDYEGDYDTDIASSAKHKDALKAHTRDVSYDGSTTADETPVTSPVFSAPPPPIHRAVPPPPPQAAPRSRPSMDTPRAPPPAPPQRDMSYDSYGGDYDPYRYNESSKPPPPVPGAIPISAPPIPPREAEVIKDESSDDMYSASPPRKSMDRPPPPPPTQPEQQAPMPPMPPMPPASQPAPPARAPPRQSLDVQRTPVASRRSMDQSRPMGDNGQIAGDINLSQETPWWTAEKPLPPVLQTRRGVDILSESEESKTSKRGGRTEISKDIYVLYIDYSQTIITARYDSQEPANVSLEQRHEPPPAKLRQDQLETYWQRFGARIADTAASLGNSKKDSTVGDGTPFALISDLIKAHPEALHPVGNRAFGALVYANLANASVMQFDEIRAGDIVTLRNAKFEGKHSGPMHQKYKQDLGAGHVAIVAEWDGTRKKVRAWEQGREKAKVRMESFRLGDLKSGEVRVWRVVGREWVGWEGEA